MVNIRDSISDLISFCSIEQTYFSNLEKVLIFICSLYAVYSREDHLNWISQIATSNFKVSNCDLERYPPASLCTNEECTSFECQRRMLREGNYRCEGDFIAKVLWTRVCDFLPTLFQQRSSNYAVGIKSPIFQLRSRNNAVT